MKIERKLLVHFDRASTEEEFLSIFSGMMAISYSGILIAMSDDAIRAIGAEIVGNSKYDTISLNILEDDIMLYDGFCSLKWYMESGDYDDYDILTVNEFIEQFGCKCHLGGDETNDCADCSYSGDYHFVDGECVRRDD